MSDEKRDWHAEQEMREGRFLAPPLWGRSFVASNGVDISIDSQGWVRVRRNVTELPVEIRLEDLRAIMSVYEWPQPCVEDVQLPSPQGEVRTQEKSNDRED